MKCPTAVRWLGALALLVAPSAAAGSVPISGTITSTLTIFDDAELTGDVSCQVDGAPCISVGAPNLTIKLNGFGLRGRATPPTGCVSTADFFNKLEDGISIASQSGITVLGPGRVENFGRYGVFAISSTGVTIRRLIVSDNCYSGIQIWTTSDSDVTENVSVRNAMGSEAFPCGGIWLTGGSTRVRVQKNELGGNGAVLPLNVNGLGFDFGVGIIGNSSDNLVEENGFFGNVNGVYLAGANTRGNVVRRNVIAGNPAMQVEATFGITGYDIQNRAPAGANLFEQNLCRTYFALVSGGTNPCLELPNFGGHRNHPPGGPPPK